MKSLIGHSVQGKKSNIAAYKIIKPSKEQLKDKSKTDCKNYIESANNELNSTDLEIHSTYIHINNLKKQRELLAEGQTFKLEPSSNILDIVEKKGSNGTELVAYITCETSELTENMIKNIKDQTTKAIEDYCKNTRKGMNSHSFKDGIQSIQVWPFDRSGINNKTLTDTCKQLTEKYQQRLQAEKESTSRTNTSTSEQLHAPAPDTRRL